MTEPPDQAAEKAWHVGRRAWRDVALDLPYFLEHVRARAISPADVEQHAADIYLAAACTRGEVHAINALERVFFSEMDRHLARLNLSAAEIDELRQDLRIKLLAGKNPRIASYAGRAPLDAWVRVAAIRLALDRKPRHPREPDVIGESALGMLMLGMGVAVEDAAVQQRARASFQEALDRSLAALADREKAMLRMYFVDGLNIDAIGVVFRVHRATVARWLVSIRRQLFEHVRRTIALDLRPTSSEFRSLVRLVEPALHLSLERLLAPSSPKAP